MPPVGSIWCRAVPGKLVPIFLRRQSINKIRSLTYGHTVRSNIAVMVRGSSCGVGFWHGLCLLYRTQAAGSERAGPRGQPSGDRPSP
jgi:hypothetical protein